MKKIIWMLLFAFTGLQLVYAQQKNDNNKDQFTYKNYTLTEGETIETLLTGGDQEFNETSLQKSIETKSSSTGLGKTIDDLMVSLSGGVNYDIPIAVPSGINGVVPKVSLNYNSQAGSGIAGFGWNVKGVSVITRVGSTKYHDNVVDPVDFDNLDRFSLDGKRLIATSGAYGANGTQYKTEIFSNLKITSHGVSPYGASYGPAYFKVHYPNGAIAYYGSTTNSRSRTNYAITYWQNPQGVRISYEYLHEFNGMTISKIKYGSRTTTTHKSEIRFIYDSHKFNARRRRTEQAFINGISFTRRNILTEIAVFGGSEQYRKYVLTHNTTRDLGHMRVIKVVEYGKDNISSKKPIVFQYTDSSPVVSTTGKTASLSLNNIEQRNSETRSFDIDGDGNMDFLVYPKDAKDKIWLFKNAQNSDNRLVTAINTGKFENILPVTALNHQSRILGGQNLAIIQKQGTKVNFNVYADYLNSSIRLNYRKTWDAPKYDYDFSCTSSDQRSVPQKYISGDFDGDGLSDIIAISEPHTSKQCFSSPCGGGGDDPVLLDNNNSQDPLNGISNSCCDCNFFTQRGGQVNLINLDRRVTTNFVRYTGYLREGISSDDILQSIDFNGDGKADILHIKNGKLYVYTIENNILKVLHTLSDSFIQKTKPILLGDYNGDGKTDFMTPEKNESKRFGMYISTGNSFSKHFKNQPFTYRYTYWNGLNGVLTGNNLIPLDINGDGKTDIVEYITTTRNNDSNGSQSLTIYNNRGLYNDNTTAANIVFINKGKTTRHGNLAKYPIPVFLSSDQPNKKLEFASISDKWVTSFKFLQDTREDVLIRSIDNGGVKHLINYNTLTKDQRTDDNFTVYQADYLRSYPYVDVQESPQTKVVTSLRRVVSGMPTVRQTYAYKGGVYNMQGLGFLGFEYVSKSNWHTDGGDRIFSVSKYNPLLRGAIVEERTQPYNFSYNSAPSDVITQTTYNNSSSTTNNKIFKLWVNSSITDNKLQNTSVRTSYIYDIYNNPTKITTTYVGAGSSVVNITYANNTGSTYYIGRPTIEKETKTIGSNSFSTEKRFSYTGYLLTGRQTKGNNTPFDSETFTYDVYGNITKRVTTPYNTTAREVRFEYDSSGRYLTKAYDAEGLATTFEYKVNDGTIARETNPYGHKTQYVYDTWNRVITSTDYLEKKLSISYNQTNNNYTVTSSGDDGSGKILTYDILERLIVEKEKNALGQWVSKNYEYDALDRVIKESEPYIGSAPTQWNTTAYDFYGRPISQAVYTGKTITTTYNNLSVTVNDGTKTTTTTKNAMGNVIRTQDTGGTINYTYYGNGGLKTSNYNGIVVSTEQDGWGRKTKLIDPSAGTYTYAYNGFGQPTTETTPKGSTYYTYDSKGKITTKRASGHNTSFTATYTYDSTTKLLKSITGTNSRVSESYRYDYYYDTLKRLRATKETNEGGTFEYAVIRDGFGRVERETHTSRTNNAANSASSIVTTKNVYNPSSGGLIEIKDFSSNQSLWKLKAINQRGQITQVKLGNNMNQKRTYDAYGFVTSMIDALEDDEGIDDQYALDLRFTFDRRRGNLTSRSNRNFSWNESFTYDNLDRLTKVSGATSITNSYDSRGRITSGSDLGTYSYVSNNSYRLKEVNLNNEGDLFYQNNPLQDIKYNSYKKPISISQQGKGKVDFRYGILQNRSHAYYGGDQSNSTQRRYEKHYSAISPVEIEVDKQGETKIITYIGGDAYSAPIVHIKQTGTNTANGYHYLHRDYLGSIIAISDNAGTIKEQRQFGAWGEVDRYKKNNSEIEFDHSALLNRGYTGHEHFFEVGLIHMNGRMYDAKLKRFLSPDNYIQDPYNTQSYNRYGYVLNNPLKYIDPSGEVGVEAVVGFFTYLVGAIFAASATYAVIGFADLWSSDSSGEASVQQQSSPSSGQNNSLEVSSGIPILDASIGDLTNLYGVLQPNTMFSSTSSEVAYATSGPSDFVSNGNEFDNNRSKGINTDLNYIESLNNVIIDYFSVDEPNPDNKIGVALTSVLAVDLSNLDPTDFLVPKWLAYGIVLAGAATYDSSKRVHITYRLTSPQGKIYIGRASGYGNPMDIMYRRFANHHKKVEGFGYPMLDRAAQGLYGYNAIRGREQQMIDAFGGVGSPNVGNKIRGVSKLNPLGLIFHNASSFYFGEVAPYTGSF